MKMIAYYDRFSIKMTLEQAETGSHPGPCDADIAHLLTFPEIRLQMDAIPPEDLASELKGYGAWDEQELSGREENKSRMLWIACGDIVSFPDEHKER